ncbi:MAG: hypothetical protein AB7P21_20195 [Lautropia sp.]
MQVIRDKIRTLLNIRVQRAAGSLGTRPRTGSRIVLGRLRMIVTCTPSDDLWYFISLLGWREVKVARDRRQYVDLPRASFEQLVRAKPTQREARYRAVIASGDRARIRSA